MRISLSVWGRHAHVRAHLSQVEKDLVQLREQIKLAETKGGTQATHVPPKTADFGNQDSAFITPIPAWQ